MGRWARVRCQMFDLGTVVKVNVKSGEVRSWVGHPAVGYYPSEVPSELDLRAVDRTLREAMGTW